MDGDDPGRKASGLIYNDLKSSVEVIEYLLTEGTDPGDCPEYVIDHIKSLV